MHEGEDGAVYMDNEEDEFEWPDELAEDDSMFWPDDFAEDESVGAEFRRHQEEYNREVREGERDDIIAEEAKADEEEASGDVPAPPGDAPRRPRRQQQRCRRFAVHNRRRVLRQPREPTEKEKEEHYLHHIPPEDWCEICSRTKTLAFAHRTIREEDRIGEVPVVSMDLCFLRRRRQQLVVPIAVIRENHRGETRAHGLLSKHMDMKLGSYIINTLVGDIGAMGFKKLILKSDQEAAMKALQVQTKKKFDGELIPQYSPKGVSPRTVSSKRQCTKLKLK